MIVSPARNRMCVVRLLPVLACLAAVAPAAALRADIYCCVDMNGFFAALGLGQPTSFCCDQAGVHYHFLALQADGTQDITIGVFPSVADAQVAYEEYPLDCLQAQVTPIQGIADQAAWLKTDGGGDHVILRRDNALVTIAWTGEQTRALDLARQIDMALTQRADICPRGESVERPVVELIAPALVVVGSTFDVRYRASRAASLRTPANPHLHGDGLIKRRTLKVGTTTTRFPFYSSKSVIFTVPLTVTAIPADAMPTEETTQPWDWPGDALYFVETQGEKWEDTPAEGRETVTPLQARLVPVKQADDWRQKALNDLAAVVEPEWLPLPGMVQVFENAARVERDTIYHACFTTRGCNILYMGTIGRRLSAYIEQPHPLPEGQEPLEPRDLLRADVAATVTDAAGEETFPRVSCLTRDVKRSRAFAPEGPYEPVNVFLLWARFASELNLRFPGYRHNRR